MESARALLATLAMVAMVLVIAPLPALAVHEVTPARVSGEDRFDTAASLARLEFPNGAATAVVATGEQFPDALAGTALTGAADAPLLLVRQDEVPEVTESALADLGVENVYLLGGPEAISAEVEAQLGTGRDLARLSGGDRYQTAAAIAREVERREDALGRTGGLTTAFVVTGEAFPDAVAVGPLAVTQSDTFPILLVGRDDYPAATQQAIADLGIEMAIVVGGPDAISRDVQARIEQDTSSTLRVFGDDRHATALALADFAMIEFDFHGELTMLSRSDDFPDALAAGLHAGRNDAPILLTPPEELAAPAHDWLHDLCPTVDVVRALGGALAIAPTTLEQAQQHAEHCHAAEGQTGETYVVEPTTEVTAALGETVDHVVRERYDDRPMQEPVDVALFPCANVDRGTGTFVDADGDGVADGTGTSNTGAARITEAHEATRVEEGYAHNLHLLHGAFSWSVRAEEADCAVVVLFDNVEGDGLAVDSEGHPLEHHGMRQVTWTSG